MATIEQIKSLLQEELAPIRESLSDLQTTVGDLQKTVGDLQKTVGDLQKTVTNLSIKQQNSLLGRYDKLVSVKRPNGVEPTIFPDCIAQLIVAGNEALPNGEINSWNKAKVYSS